MGFSRRGCKNVRWRPAEAGHRQHFTTERLPTMHIETLAVHAGYQPDPTTKSAAVPLYQTVAYAFDSAQHGADLFDLKGPATSTHAS